MNAAAPVPPAGFLRCGDQIGNRCAREPRSVSSHENYVWTTRSAKTA